MSAERRPRLLDLFCGAGGCSVGYERVGFEVVGVDVAPQPHYPFQFFQHEAIDFLRSRPLSAFDAIHASPPCQANSKLRVLWRDRNYEDLIAPTRELLIEIGKPWVIENVEGADLPQQNTLDGRYGVTLCGSAFGLPLRRHRLFESTFPIPSPGCHHDGKPVVGVYGHTGAGANRGRARANGQANGIAEWSEAMGIDWMTCDEIAEAIPPAYTEFIGARLMQEVEARVAA